MRAEEKLALDNQAVVATYKTAKNLYDNTKKLMVIKGKTCTNRCTNMHHENYHEQLERLVLFYHECKKKLEPMGAQLVKSKKSYEKEHKKLYRSLAVVPLLGVLESRLWAWASSSSLPLWRGCSRCCLCCLCCCCFEHCRVQLVEGLFRMSPGLTKVFSFWRCSIT